MVGSRGEEVRRRHGKRVGEGREEERRKEETVRTRLAEGSTTHTHTRNTPKHKTPYEYNDNARLLSHLSSLPSLPVSSSQYPSCRKERRNKPINAMLGRKDGDSYTTNLGTRYKLKQPIYLSTPFSSHLHVRGEEGVQLDVLRLRIQPRPHLQIILTLLRPRNMVLKHLHIR